MCNLPGVKMVKELEGRLGALFFRKLEHVVSIRESVEVRVLVVLRAAC